MATARCAVQYRVHLESMQLGATLVKVIVVMVCTIQFPIHCAVFLLCEPVRKLHGRGRLKSRPMPPKGREAFTITRSFSRLNTEVKVACLAEHFTTEEAAAAAAAAATTMRVWRILGYALCTQALPSAAAVEA